MVMAFVSACLTDSMWLFQTSHAVSPVRLGGIWPARSPGVKHMGSAGWDVLAVRAQSHDRLQQLKELSGRH